MDDKRLKALENMEKDLEFLEHEVEEEDLEKIDKTLESIEKSLSGITSSYDPTLDGKVIIEIKDNLKAYLKITMPKIGGKRVELEDIWKAIKDKRIKEVDEKLVNSILQDRRYNEEILIATGISPEEGEDAYLAYRFKKGEVYPGQVLMIKVPATSGKQGRSVTGEIIPGSLGSDIKIICGRNVFLERDGLQAYATSKGLVNWEDNKLTVEKIYEIPGDLKKGMGKIDFPGKVRIGGSIEDGVQINAGADIEVMGNVGDSLLEAKGTVRIKQDILGKGKGKIVASGDVIAKSCEDIEIDVKGNLLVEGEIVNCRIKVLGVVKCLGKKGQILGGKIEADKVDARSIGSIEKVKTEIKASEVSILENIYQGVKLVIDKVPVEIKKGEKAATFRLHDGKVEREAYQEIELKPSVSVGEPESNFDFSRYPRSIVIESSSLEEGKKEGAKILGLGLHDVTCTEIERIDGRVKVRVFQKGFKVLPWEAEDESVEEINISGSFKLENTKEGLFLTVYPPKGKGKRVKIEDIQSEIEDRGYINIDRNSLKSTVDEEKGVPVKIGEHQRRKGIDAQVSVELSEDKSRAEMIVIPEKDGGLPIKYEDVINALREKGVVACIKEDVIKDVINNKKWNTSILVAEEIPPTPGYSAEIEYSFRKDLTKVHLVEDEHGRIDFHELNLIKNVEEGELLAKKKTVNFGGKPGLRLSGEEIPPTFQDVRLPAGRNTEISEDGQELRAKISGHVVWANERINIEPIYDIKGDIDFHSGNINFLGTVMVGGDVKDGFKINASGDIQVKNGVGKATLNAKGNILIGAGVQGKEEATLRASGDIVAKFVENAHLISEENIIIQEEVLHSELDSGKKIQVLGKRGSIVGGKIRAVEEVTARVLGCEVSTRTLVEVGVTPRIRGQLETLEKMYKIEDRNLERIKLDISTLERWKKEGHLSERRLRLLTKLIKRRNILQMKLRSYIERKEILESQIARSLGGKVNVIDTLYPGVTIVIRSARLDIKEKMKSVTLYFEGNEVKTKPYEGK
ncbi:MAG: FapA family protein [bacterium]|nr:FapA family protein [bacterium]